MSPGHPYRVAWASVRGRILLNWEESGDHTPLWPWRAPATSWRARLERWKKVVRRDPCAYCGAPAGTIDHIVPKVSRAHGQRSRWFDYTGACLRCNADKADRPLLLFLLHRREVVA